VKPIFATNNFLLVVAKLIADNFAAPRAKIAELSIEIAAPDNDCLAINCDSEPSTIHP
jgi:hypothetical protein